MELTIIGVYDDRAHASAARHELLASGFTRGSVQLNPDHEPSGTAPSPQAGKSAADSGVGNFFRSLFSTEDKTTYSNVYAEAVRRGSYVLIVEVGSDEQRIRAEEIMTGHGPVDIEERSAAWIRQGWRGHDPDAARHAPAPNMKGRLRAFLRRKDRTP